MSGAPSTGDLPCVVCLVHGWGRLLRRPTTVSLPGLIPATQPGTTVPQGYRDASGPLSVLPPGPHLSTGPVWAVPSLGATPVLTPPPTSGTPTTTDYTTHSSSTVTRLVPTPGRRETLCPFFTSPRPNPSVLTLKVPRTPHKRPPPTGVPGSEGWNVSGTRTSSSNDSRRQVQDTGVQGYVVGRPRLATPLPNLQCHCPSSLVDTRHQRHGRTGRPLYSGEQGW